MSELKACPFCYAPHVWLAPHGKQLRCIQCGAESPDGRNPSLTWNTRPVEDALRARVAELEGTGDRLRALEAALTKLVTAANGAYEEYRYVRLVGTHHKTPSKIERDLSDALDTARAAGVEVEDDAENDSRGENG